MKIQDFYPEFEVIRNDSRCTRCRLCERQCANGVHSFDESRRLMLADESRCVNCSAASWSGPVRQLKIDKSDCAPRENANWDADTIREVYKQAASGGVLLSSHGQSQTSPHLLGSDFDQRLPSDQSLH